MDPPGIRSKWCRSRKGEKKSVDEEPHLLRNRDTNQTSKVFLDGIKKAHQRMLGRGELDWNVCELRGLKHPS